MRWSWICVSLALLLGAAPALALDAVPFAGFSGLLYGSPGAPVVDVPARSYVALYALAEYGGTTEVGTICELQGAPQALARGAASQLFVVIVSLVRSDGSSERIARFKMRLRDGNGEAARVREMTAAPGDYLLFEFRRKGNIQLTGEQQMLLYGYAGAPDVR